jgi:hypothetical protein
MVHRQHVGPVGQYHIPERSRFRWDRKPGKLTSVTPGIEVVATGGGGREESHFDATLRIGERLYSLRAVVEDECDQFGAPIFNYRNGVRKQGDRVWLNVHLLEVMQTDGGESRQFIEMPIADFDDQLTQIIMDFLTVETGILYPRKTTRIVFSDVNPITPKNYKVERNS